MAFSCEARGDEKNEEIAPGLHFNDGMQEIEATRQRGNKSLKISIKTPFKSRALDGTSSIFETPKCCTTQCSAAADTPLVPRPEHDIWCGSMRKRTFRIQNSRRGS